MTWRAKELGISVHSIELALTLVRDLRTRVLEWGIDPRATRIALIYANKVDFHEARKKLSEKELVDLEHIADEYFQVTLRAIEKKGVR